MNARETILDRLRRAPREAYGSDRRNAMVRPESGERGARILPTVAEPSPGKVDASLAATGDLDAMERRFAAQLRSLDGLCDIVGSPAAARERVAELMEGVGPDVLSWAPNQLPLPGLREALRRQGVAPLVPEDLHDPALRSEAASAEVGVTGVEAAFAETGSLLLASGPGRSRVASLLPLRHIALVPRDRIFASFEDWLGDARRNARLTGLLRESAQLVFITGPSRSADIELNLTLGVHGPRMVHAIVFPPT